MPFAATFAITFGAGSPSAIPSIPGQPSSPLDTRRPRDLALKGGRELDLRNGQLNFVAGTDWLRQALETNLSLIAGEWFLDPTVGVPIFDRILVKNPDLALIRSVFHDAIAAVPHVTGIQNLAVELDASSRQLSVSFEVTTDLPGPSVSGSIGG